MYSIKQSIGIDNKGLAAGWHLKEVHIESLSDGRKWLVECNQWFDRNEGDGKTKLALVAPRVRSGDLGAVHGQIHFSDGSIHWSSQSIREKQQQQQQGMVH